MSDEDVAVTEAEAQQELPPEPLKVDWFLRNLVDLINQRSFGISISLHVSGFVVSGTLISGRQYFEELGAMVGDAMSHSPELAESFRAYFTQPATLVYGQEEDEQKSAKYPSFIHLKDARFFRSGNQVAFPNQGVLWRGKLVDVSGFFVGSISVN